MAWVDDDGSPIEAPADPIAQVHIDAMEQAQHARDLEEAGRVAGLTIQPTASATDEPVLRWGPGAPSQTFVGAVLDAVMDAVMLEATPVQDQLVLDVDRLQERADAVSFLFDRLEQKVEEIKAHLIYIEHEWGIGGSTDALEMLPAARPLDTPDIGSVDRPLTRDEDQARAQAIAAEARREADRLRDEDLRGIDQAAPDAPPPPAEDEVVIPVQGPKGGFR